MSLTSLLLELPGLDQPLRAADLAHLSNMAPEDLAAFESTWPEVSATRRRELIKGLVELAEDNVELNFDAVFMFALADADPGVRRDAIQGFWEYEGSVLVDRLAAMLETDEDAGVRADAALALGRFALKAEFDVLSPAKRATVDRVLRQAFVHEAEPVEVRARALESLGARSEPWVSDLIDQAYDSSERPLRLGAVHAMGRSADPTWLETLRAESESDDAAMRFEVAVAAGAIAHEDAIPLLLELVRDEDDEVRDAAVTALGEIGGATAKEVLRDLLDDPADRVRDAAVDALREAEFADDPLGVKVID